VAELLPRLQPGIVLLDHPVVAPLVSRRTAGGEPWMMTLHNLGTVLAAHEAAVTRGRRQRWLLGRERGKSAAFERWCLEAFDAVVCVTAEDAELLPGPVAVVPNGVDCAALTLTPVPPDPVIVFTGALHTAPNIDGICWFVESVWPDVIAARPEARLEIVGSRPPGTVTDLAAPTVTVHADVPDTTPFLRRARVAVVPLRIGSGSRLKALEAFAAGRPVVGTTIGLGGLPVRPHVHAEVADDAAGFAAAVVRLLDDDDRASSLAIRGRELVDDAQLCWAQIGPRFARLVSDLAQ
jgi:glycosyltransferase involved in cell wall biosynthesis